ncbi:hypothetical protein L21SP2_3254 [Salinispira pacifica]|uniref:Uncharacterized protein n=1 Tax=Salinispira pacifica TaxID=1307761 RepID=V5WN39_9SPIO|nr:hypothetical protein L21SP2_3254 [Salinispira pacifica]
MNSCSLSRPTAFPSPEEILPEHLSGLENVEIRLLRAEGGMRLYALEWLGEALRPAAWTSWSGFSASGESAPGVELVFSRFDPLPADLNYRLICETTASCAHPWALDLRWLEDGLVTGELMQPDEYLGPVRRVHCDFGDALWYSWYTADTGCYSGPEILEMVSGHPRRFIAPSRRLMKTVVVCEDGRFVELDTILPRRE